MSACDICDELANNPDYTVDLPTALREIIKLLCGSRAGTPVEQTTVAFGAVPQPAYAVPATLDNGDTPLHSVTILNTTNKDIFVSSDGVTDNYVVPAGLERTFGVGGTELWIRAASAPGSGSVYISGY
jgi:hypothetical protein